MGDYIQGGLSLLQEGFVGACVGALELPLGRSVGYIDFFMVGSVGLPSITPACLWR